MISVYQLHYCIGPGLYHHERYMFAELTDEDEDVQSLIGYSFPADFNFIGDFNES